MKSILVVGCGRIGERYSRCFQLTNQAAVTACDANPNLLQRMADFRKDPMFRAANATMVEEFDAVVIGTPARLPVPMALQALRCDFHAFVEEPLSQALESVDVLLASANSGGRVLCAAVRP
jgi:predicted dehydrogenase